MSDKEILAVIGIIFTLIFIFIFILIAFPSFLGGSFLRQLFSILFFVGIVLLYCYLTILRKPSIISMAKVVSKCIVPRRYRISYVVDFMFINGETEGFGITKKQYESLSLGNIIMLQRQGITVHKIEKISKDKVQPIISSRAKVESKKIIKSSNKAYNCAYFRLIDHRLCELVLSKELYNLIKPGDIVDLERKGFEALSIKKISKNKKQPIKSSRAKVMERTTQFSTAKSGGSFQGANFLFSDKKIYELKLTSQQYKSIREGDIVDIEYQDYIVKTIKKHTENKKLVKKPVSE